MTIKKIIHNDIWQFINKLLHMFTLNKNMLKTIQVFFFLNLDTNVYGQGNKEFLV